MTNAQRKLHPIHETSIEAKVIGAISTVIENLELKYRIEIIPGMTLLDWYLRNRWVTFNCYNGLATRNRS